MAKEPRPIQSPCETGTTAGGGLLAASGAFFRWFRKTAPAAPAAQPATTRPRLRLYADQQWLVTYERPNGDVGTAAVIINGGHLQADIEALARMALHNQCGIDCATILRIKLDFRATPARIEFLDRITRAYHARIQFEQECG